MGAAGRDFHNFNCVYRDNPNYKVVCFTAAQLPGIAGRKYPPSLAGKLYPQGIPIYDEKHLAELVKKLKIDEVILAYSDLSHEYVMQKAEFVLSLGADFKLLGPKATMIKSKRKLISICAVRTGVGKSEVTRHICDLLRKRGIKFVVIRHPMPYGILKEQVWQRFEKYEDLDRYKCTIEEREEYEPHIKRGEVVYAGVDYGEILKRAEKEAQVIVWDGGNNDLPFYKPDLHIVLVDPHRPGHETSYYPGEANLMMADVVIVNKEKTAKKADIEFVKANVKRLNPRAVVVDGSSVISLEKNISLNGKRVLIVEDGPTLTHGGMTYGAGTLAVRRQNVRIVNPEPYAKGSIKNIFKTYPHIKNLLPAHGYSPKQMKELQDTINATPADAVIIGTPINLGKLLKLNKPAIEVQYEFEEISNKLGRIINHFLRR